MTFLFFFSFSFFVLETASFYVISAASRASTFELKDSHEKGRAQVSVWDIADCCERLKEVGTTIVIVFDSPNDYRIDMT